MKITRISLLVSISIMLLSSLNLWGGSDKRGLCWDESNVKLNDHHASLLTPGVCWVYNWGPDAWNSGIYGDSFSFLPMAWNGAYNASRIRTWLSNHPETKYLLGFNEPNFATQARMTPQQAADAWPALETIAEEFGVKLVAPALNFSGDKVGERVWSPYEWYDAFFEAYPEAKVDCLAIHCYMNWYSANTWFATEYFYKDLFDSSKECYNRYPNLVRFLNNFKEVNGHFPRMMLTEFCAWENDGSIKNVEFQIDQMTQKVQKLEQSDLVEGYAWFMGNSGSGASAYPYMSVMERNAPDSKLSELGEVYVNMSAFDKSKYYLPGEEIEAKDYVDATTDNAQIRVRRNSDDALALPLQIEIPSSGYPAYQIDVPEAGRYSFDLRLKTYGPASVSLYVDNKKNAEKEIDIPSGIWTNIEIETELTKGRHTLMPYNSGSASLFVNSIRYNYAGGAGVLAADPGSEEPAEIFNLQGVSLGNADIRSLPNGIYIVRLKSGKTIKLKK